MPTTLLNKLVVNFLIIEGYRDCAERFIQEANINLDDPVNKDMRVDFSEKLIEQRTQVRKFILSGHIEEAIILLNDISPIVSDIFKTDYQILDRNPELNFELLKQQLIEIIKAQKVEEAIKFAQTNIAPLCQ